MFFFSFLSYFIYLLVDISEYFEELDFFYESSVWNVKLCVHLSTQV